MKLLIHHHAEAYIDKHGIWMQSFIGAWASEISKNIKQVGLLVHITETKRKNLDYCIRNSNVKVESLGLNKGLKNRANRLAYIKKKSQSLIGYSHLLVRGVTPRQALVMQNSPIKKKFFLFVGCLADSEAFQIKGAKSGFRFFMKSLRNWELRKISAVASFASNSPSTALEVRGRFKIESVFIPTNTISIEDFCLNESKEDCNQLRMLFVGRVTREKGIEELLGAFEKITSCYNLRKPILNIVGPYSNNYMDKLKKNYSMENIKFHGFIPFGAKLLEFYDSSNLYILPSYHEGFPHTIWEAAARDLAVVCTPVGGIPGLVDETMVKFVEAKNQESICLTVQEFFSNRETFERKRQKLRNAAKENSLEESVSKLLRWMSE